MKIKNLAVAALVSLPLPLIGQQLTDDMVAYWKLDEIVGGRTPDAAGSFDMTAVNLVAARDVVPGRWGNAIQFNGGRTSILERIHSPGDDLPLEQHANFSVSIWVKGDALAQQGDRRIFSEASDQNNNPLFNIGTHNTAADGTVDAYVRGNNGTLNHGHTEAEAFDDQWRHVVWVQMGAAIQVYVDAVATDILVDGAATNESGRPLANPGQPYRVNTTSIGGIRRAAASHWFTGLIDDVAVWKRALNAGEVTELFTNGTPDPGVVVEPLEVRSFSVERTKVAVGSDAVLRWEGSKDAMFSIDQGVGSVDAMTALGAGEVGVPVTADTTFTLTASRGGESVTATVSVEAVEGIAPGWVFVDDFEGYTPGPVVDVANPFWSNPNATPSWEVVDDGGNQAVAVADVTQQVLFTRLGSLVVSDGESRTAYFHLRTDDTDFGLKYHMGMTNKALRGFQEDTNGNLGGFLVVERFDLDTEATLYSGAFDFNDPEYRMMPGEWYRLWVDVTNSPGELEDVVSAYIQGPGDAERVALFEDSIGDRGNEQDLIYFYIAAEEGTLIQSAILMDNVFLSANGTLDTDPLGGGGGPVAGDFEITDVTVDEVTMELTLVWSGDVGGTYNVESSVTGVGTWREEADDINGLTATVSMDGGSRLYRVRRTD